MQLREVLLIPFIVILFSPFLVAQNIWLEAECGMPSGQWDLVDETTPEILQSVQALIPDHLNGPSSDPNSWLRYQIELNNGGNYVAYARVKALDEGSNSVWIRVNNGSWVLWDDIKTAPPLTSDTQPDLPVIPGATGYGITTPAGRGGTIYKVTNLNDSGPGSLRACVEANGARVCVFEVGGFIDLQSPLAINDPYITIAGQTAPSPGIMVGRGYGIQVYTHDVLIQHIGVRPGDGPGIFYNNRDAMQLNGASSPTDRVHNVVLDHVTMAWAMDENLGMWGYLGDITVRNCIIAQAMSDPFEVIGEPSYGNLIGAFDQEGRVSLYGNFYTGNRDRQPLSRNKTLFFANNLLYDRVLRFVYLSNRAYNGTGGYPTDNTVIGNAFVEGPDMSYNLPHERPITFDENGQLLQSRLFVEDNWWSYASYPNQWDYVKDAAPGIQVFTPPVWVPDYPVIRDKDSIIQYVTSQAGARPLDRNYLDQRLFDEFWERKASVVTCVEGCAREIGGWPALTPTYRALTLPANPNADPDQNGYTNLEEWLHAFARGVENTTGDYVWDQIRDSNEGTPLQLALGAGTNTIEVAVREPGLLIDKFHFSQSPVSLQGPGLTGFGCDSTLSGTNDCLAPLPWQALDIGAVGLSGSSCLDTLAQSVKITGSGADIWGSSDAFQYVYQELAGSQDFTFEARLTSLDSVHSWTKAGLMVRDGLHPEAANVMMYLSGANRWAFQYRLLDGDQTSSITSAAGDISLPYWIKLEKDGNQVTGLISADGINWTIAGQTTFYTSSQMQVGLAVTSHVNSQLTVAEFDQLSLTPVEGENSFPVELLDFSAVAQPQNLRVQLSWHTGQESNNDFFTVERSVDNLSFMPLARVYGQGNSTTPQSYSWDDLNPINGKTYYRLKQTDLDGQIEIFPSVEVNYQHAPVLKARVYPNPLQGGQTLRVDVWSEAAVRWRFELFNHLGQKVWSRELSEIRQGRTFLQISMPVLAPGMYFFKGSGGNGRDAAFFSEQLWFE